MMAAELIMTRETGWQILTETLEMRKIVCEESALNPDRSYRMVLQMSFDLKNAEVFDRVITSDKTWCFQYDPETKTRA